MGITESYEDFRSLGKLAFGVIYAFFILQMLLFYWKSALKSEGEVTYRWGGILKAIAKAAHYEIVPSLTMFLLSIYVFSFEIVGILLFLISIVGYTLIVLGYHRSKEGFTMLLLGRLIAHFSTLAVLIMAMAYAGKFASPLLN